MNAARGETKRSDSRSRVEPNGHPDSLGWACLRPSASEWIRPWKITRLWPPPRCPRHRLASPVTPWRRLRRRSRPTTTGGSRDKAKRLSGATGTLIGAWRSTLIQTPSRRLVARPRGETGALRTRTQTWTAPPLADPDPSVAEGATGWVTGAVVDMAGTRLQTGLQGRLRTPKQARLGGGFRRRSGGPLRA